jgi:hypothetical protein
VLYSQLELAYIRLHLPSQKILDSHRGLIFMQSMRDMLWAENGPASKCSKLHAKLIVSMGCVADMNSFITTTVTTMRASLLTFRCT